jgi:pantoate--beta-alanine ligase
MLVVRTVADLRAQMSALRREGKTVALVPTMGALHAGHLELIRQAGVDCDAVVLSIFVNPAQFDDTADLAAYPRTESRDLELATAAGVDVAFVPAVSEIYPPGFTASVALHGPIVETFEGAERSSSHFAGVTTVVSKLFNMVGADRAYFGQKDAQQLHVVRAMVADLNIDIEVTSVPTVREPDGMALSSRNVRLSPSDRGRAAELSRALHAGLGEFRTGTRNAADLLSTVGKVLASAGIVPEYLAVVSESSFTPVDLVDEPALILLAARIGSVRLIDNVVLGPG